MWKRQSTSTGNLHSKVNVPGQFNKWNAEVRPFSRHWNSKSLSYMSPKKLNYHVVKNVSKNPMKVIKKKVTNSPSSVFTKFGMYQKKTAYKTLKKIHKRKLNAFQQPYSYYQNQYALRSVKYKPFQKRVTNKSWTSKYAVPHPRFVTSTYKSRNVTLKRTPIKSNLMLKNKATPSPSFKSSYVRLKAKQAVKRSRRQIKKTKKAAPKTHCLVFNRFGKCNRGDKCKYLHDPRRIALCTRFLRGKCRSPSCPFSHEITKSKVPVCSFFLRGNCKSQDCPYLHVFVGKDAPVCKQFASTGFCPKADACKEQHLRVCPEFYEKNTCSKPKGKCQLPHKSKSKTKKQIFADKRIKRKKEIEEVNNETFQTIPKIFDKREDNNNDDKEVEDNPEDEELLTIPRLFTSTSTARSNHAISHNSSTSLSTAPHQDSSDEEDFRTVPNLFFKK